MPSANQVRQGFLLLCFALPGFGLLLVSLLVVGLHAPDAAACERAAEREIVDAVLNLDPERLEAVAGSADTGRFRIPSIAFYRALSTWYRGYQEDNKSLKTKGISGIRKAISEMGSSMDDHTSLDYLLSMGLARGHFARILLEGEKILAGYRNGMRAREHLGRYLELAPRDAPGRADANMLAGLYEVYTHDLQNRFHWLTGTIEYRGNRDRGVRMLERTLSGRGVFSSEALRALLGEVSWRTPDFCRYIDLAESRARSLPRNHDLAVLALGLQLKCGFSDRARDLVDWYRSRGPVAAIDNRLGHARLRILADLGELEALQALTPLNRDPYHLLATANALDVEGRREEALSAYGRLLEFPGIEGAFRSVARVRQRYPYSPPPKTDTRQFSVADCGLDLVDGPGVR